MVQKMSTHIYIVKKIDFLKVAWSDRFDVSLNPKVN